MNEDQYLFSALTILVGILLYALIVAAAVMVK